VKMSRQARSKSVQHAVFKICDGAVRYRGVKRIESQVLSYGPAHEGRSTVEYAARRLACRLCASRQSFENTSGDERQVVRQRCSARHRMREFIVRSISTSRTRPRSVVPHVPAAVR